MQLGNIDTDSRNSMQNQKLSLHLVPKITKSYVTLYIYLNHLKNSIFLVFCLKKKKDLCGNLHKYFLYCNIFQINRIKLGPDEDSASDFALNSYCRCIGHQAA